MANLEMAPRSPSPSARFYAHSSTPDIRQMHRQLPSTDGPEAPRAHHIEPFEQFQGLLAPSTRQECVHSRFGSYGYKVPEEDISPRLVIPDLLSLKTDRSRVQAFVGHDVEDNDAQSRIYQASCNVDLDRNAHVVPEQFEVATQQWPSSHNLSTNFPPIPRHICVNSQEKLHNVQRGPGYHAEASPHMPVSASRHPNTFRVPSDSEPGHVGGRLGSPHLSIFPDDLEAEEGACSISSSILGEGEDTIYPEDSVSATSRTGARPNAVPVRSLVDHVVEIHDICLAATQRHLNNLRVNWDLRLGRPVVGVEEHSLGGRPARGHDRGHGDRRAPYASVLGSHRRALSESHIEHMTMGNKREHCRDVRYRHPDFALQNPIPKCTNSLLENIRHICHLIWRRAQRDREDVLGAELKACREMGFLHECGEMIVLYNTVDAERDPQDCWHRIVTAGRGICQALGDLDGMRLMELGQMD